MSDPAASVSVVGVGGYTGQELARLVIGHPVLRLSSVFGSDATSGRPLADVAPAIGALTHRVLGQATAEAILDDDAGIVALATPHAVSAELAPKLLDAGRIVLDLSAAYRLRDASAYPAFYGFEHAHAGLLERAVYGMAEIERDRIATADLIAVPGCYPTSAVIPLAPLVRAGLADEQEPVIIDSTSGVSGAGRSASQRTLFCEVSQSPYGVLTHRHTPEIREKLGTDVLFTPHLGPYQRGICSTMHIKLRDGVDETALRAALESAYAGEPFVRLLPASVWPSVAGVERTNRVDIGLAVSEPHGRAIVIACIDNLLKGAAGQAVQCLNLRLGLDEPLGLPGARGS
ncbi:MAG: N-acetyl-gamma-glutamyl-phosphate reductase [Planctomycetota bacterium]